MLGLIRGFFLLTIAVLLGVHAQQEVTQIVEETETITSTSVMTLYTCRECKKTAKTSDPVTATVTIPTTVVTTAPPITVTAECIRKKKVVLMTKTICPDCHGLVNYTDAPTSLSSIYSEIMATLKPCVRCDNSPQCTEPVGPMESGNMPPCRICCSAPTAAK